MSSPDRLRDVAKEALEGLVSIVVDNSPHPYRQPNEFIPAEDCSECVNDLTNLLQSEREDAAREAVEGMGPKELFEALQQFGFHNEDTLYSGMMAAMVAEENGVSFDDARKHVEYVDKSGKGLVHQLTLDECFARVVELGGVEHRVSESEASFYRNNNCASIDHEGAIGTSGWFSRLRTPQEALDLAQCLIHAAHEMEMESLRQDDEANRAEQIAEYQAERMRGIQGGDSQKRLEMSNDAYDVRTEREQAHAMKGAEDEA